jgi:hypothetical protein
VDRQDAEDNKIVYIRFWRDMAELINKLPIEERRKYYENLGKFVHDMRHTLGLITNAQDLLRRDIVERARISDPLSLLNIIKMASMRGSTLVNDVAEAFGTHIDLGEEM